MQPFGRLQGSGNGTSRVFSLDRDVEEVDVRASFGEPKLPHSKHLSYLRPVGSPRHGALFCSKSRRSFVRLHSGTDGRRFSSVKTGPLVHSLALGASPGDMVRKMSTPLAAVHHTTLP